jgi:midasin
MDTTVRTRESAVKPAIASNKMATEKTVDDVKSHSTDSLSLQEDALLEPLISGRYCIEGMVVTRNLRIPEEFDISHLFYEQEIQERMEANASPVPAETPGIPYVKPDLDFEDDDNARHIPGTVLVDTPSTVKNLQRLAYSTNLAIPVWLEGPTGSGKTATVKYLSRLTEQPLRRLNLNDMSDIQEIIGGYKPSDGNPLLSVSDVTDWPSFTRNLQNPDTPGKERVWKLMDEDSREFISSCNPDDMGLLDQSKVVDSLNWVIKAKNFYDPKDIDKSGLDPLAQETLGKTEISELPGDERRIFNRRVFESVFPSDVVKADQKAGRPEWSNGVVVDAMVKGHLLLLDEFNLAEPGVLERLNPLLEGDRQIVLTEKNHEMVEAHDDFRVFTTSNPVTYSGRKQMSDAMNNRLKKLQFREPSPEEIVEIIQLGGLSSNELLEFQQNSANMTEEEIAQVKSRGSSLSAGTLFDMTSFHCEIAKMANHNLLGKIDGPFPYTIRDVTKWVDRVEHFRKEEPDMDLDKLVRREAKHVYMDRCSQDVDRDQIEKTYDIIFGMDSRINETEDKKITPMGSKVKIGGVELDVNEEGGQFVPKTNLTDVPSAVDVMEKMAKGVTMQEPILLVGPTAAGKTAKVKYLANLTNNNVRRYNLSMQTDTTEFIGGYKPTGKPGEYKWVDGIVVDAMKKGHWMLLDEYNLADPAIAERLNSLLEDGRELLLSEKGNEIVEAHPNFRIFATMNPSSYEGRNEVSLAARNRFSEVWDQGIANDDELKTIMCDFLSDEVEDKEKTASKMVDFQSIVEQKVENRELAAKQRDKFIYTIRNLQRWSDFMNMYAPETGTEEAFVEGASFLYGSDFTDEQDDAFVTELAKQLYATEDSPENKDAA